LFLIGCLLLSGLIRAEEEPQADPRSRFEFEYSFKGPYIAQTDGLVPFWSYHGHAIAGDENVRLAPSLRSRQGSIWTKKMFSKEWFEIEIVIRISGRGKIGADGMAIWYTTEGAPSQADIVPIYGARDKWNGLGIILDSFDNNSKGDNPIIMMHVNDGTKNYNHNEDGGGEEVGGCRRDFRNRPYPVKLKLRYFKNVLELYYHGGVTEFDDYELCSRAENVVLPKEGYFGVSAATGGLSDDHDVLKFLTHSLTDPETDEPEISAEEKELREKLEQELKDKEEEFEKEKQKFAEENPELAAQMEGREEDLKSGDDPQFKAIFDVQNHIQEHIIGILAAINEAKDMIGEIKIAPPSESETPQSDQQATGAPETAKIPENVATKNDIVTIEQRQGQLSKELQDLQTMIRDVQQKTNSIFNNQGPTTNDRQVEQLQKQEEKIRAEMMKASLNTIKQDLQMMTRKQEMLNQKKCPPTPEVACVSSSFFVIISLIQGALIGFIVHYKMSQEAAAKKFF
jgi:mannose-binding lectin 1